MDLKEIGWDTHYSKIKDTLSTELELIAGRVTSFSGKHYWVICEKGEILGILSNSYLSKIEDKSDIPAVGDWVGLEKINSLDLYHIRYLFPRKNKLSRKASGKTSEEQIIASNIDIVFIVTSLDNDFNMKRLERYLSLAYTINAKPVIILNKIDKVDDVEHYIEHVKKISDEVVIIPICAKSGVGLDSITPFCGPGTTSVLIGSSGVGKSTIINQLLGCKRQLTGETRKCDDKGRHVTSSRQLFVLPNGGAIIDNPGIRELQLWFHGKGLERQFEDIEILSKMCKFRDCKHDDEPGCAVREAVELGKISKDHLDNYSKLLKEREYLNLRRSTYERRAKDRKLSKMYRKGKDIRRFKGEK